MAREPFLLDSSALLTLIENEAGAERVEQVLREETTLVPWTALLEIYYITRRRRNVAEAERRYALIAQMPAEILWEIDERWLLKAGEIKAGHRLSLADAMIAAHAIAQGAVLLHKDPEFQPLASEVRLEALPYKSAS